MRQNEMKDKDSHKFTLFKMDKQATVYDDTRKKIGEHVGREHGNDCMKLVLHGKENEFTEPELKKKTTDYDKISFAWMGMNKMRKEGLCFKYGMNRAKATNVLKTMTAMTTMKRNGMD